MQHYANAETRANCIASPAFPPSNQERLLTRMLLKETSPNAWTLPPLSPVHTQHSSPQGNRHGEPLQRERQFHPIVATTLPTSTTTPDMPLHLLAHCASPDHPLRAKSSRGRGNTTQCISPTHPLRAIAMASSSRDALPALSPMPLMVHSICRAPAMAPASTRGAWASTSTYAQAGAGSCMSRVHQPCKGRWAHMWHAPLHAWACVPHEHSAACPPACMGMCAT